MMKYEIIARFRNEGYIFLKNIYTPDQKMVYRYIMQIMNNEDRYIMPYDCRCVYFRLELGMSSSTGMTGSSSMVLYRWPAPAAAGGCSAL